MSGNSVLLDTNIALYLLGGDENLADMLYERTLYLSFINQIELLGFKGITSQQKQQIARFIKDCIVIDLTIEIKEEVIELRKKTTLKIPDCFVLATAKYLKIPMLTSDADFANMDGYEVILYDIK